MPATTVVLDRDDIRRTLVRIAHEIVEKNPPEPGEKSSVALVGIHRRGAILAQRLHALTSELLDTPVPLGDVDISFYRDDLSRNPVPTSSATHIDDDLTDRTVVLVDDVLFTGRTIRAALNALSDWGRPHAVQLAVLVDRGHRELPIRPDFVGKNLPTSLDEAIVATLDGVWIGTRGAT